MDPHYREHCEHKHAKCRTAGIAPWQEGGGPNGTLIETYDEPDGSFNLETIDKLIDEVIRGRK